MLHSYPVNKVLWKGVWELPQQWVGGSVKASEWEGSLVVVTQVSGAGSLNPGLRGVVGAWEIWPQGVQKDTANMTWWAMPNHHDFQTVGMFILNLISVLSNVLQHLFFFRFQPLSFPLPSVYLPGPFEFSPCMFTLTHVFIGPGALTHLLVL